MFFYDLCQNASSLAKICYEKNPTAALNYITSLRIEFYYVQIMNLQYFDNRCIFVESKKGLSRKGTYHMFTFMLRKSTKQNSWKFLPKLLRKTMLKIAPHLFFFSFFKIKSFYLHIIFTSNLQYGHAFSLREHHLPKNDKITRNDVILL